MRAAVLILLVWTVAVGVSARQHGVLDATVEAPIGLAASSSPMRFAIAESDAANHLVVEAELPGHSSKPAVPIHHGLVASHSTTPAVRTPVIGGSQSEDAGLTTVLRFFMNILSNQLAKSNSPLVKLMDQLIAQKFPRGFPVGPDYTLTGFNFAEPVVFTPPVLQGVSVIDNRNGVLNLNVASMSFGVASVKIQLNFASATGAPPMGAKYITVKDCVFRGGAHVNIDATGMPTFKVAPGFNTGSFGFSLGSASLDGKDWGVVEEMVNQALNQPIAPISFTPTTQQILNSMNLPVAPVAHK